MTMTNDNDDFAQYNTNAIDLYCLFNKTHAYVQNICRVCLFYIENIFSHPIGGAADPIDLTFSEYASQMTPTCTYFQDF